MRNQSQDFHEKEAIKKNQTNLRAKEFKERGSVTVVKQVKLSMVLAFHIGVPIQVPVSLLPVKFPADVPIKGA